PSRRTRSRQLSHRVRAGPPRDARGRIPQAHRKVAEGVVMAMPNEPGYAGLGPRLPLRELVPMPRFAAAVWLRNARVFSKLWRGALLPTFLDPFLYLLALGFGLGTYIASINGIPYQEFTAPGFIAP